MSDQVSDVSTGPPGPPGKRAGSSRLPVLRKPSSTIGQAPKQTSGGPETISRGAAKPLSTAPKAPNIVKRASSAKTTVSNAATPKGGNVIGTTRSSELRRASAAKLGSLAPTLEDECTTVSKPPPSTFQPPLSSKSSKDPLKSVKEQRRATSVYIPSSIIQRKASSPQVNVQTTQSINRRASASNLPTASNVSKKLSGSSLARKPSTSQLSSAPLPMSKKPSAAELKAPTTLLKKTSTPKLNKRISNSTISLPFNKDNISRSPLRKAPDSSNLRISAPSAPSASPASPAPFTPPAPSAPPTTPITPITKRSTSKPVPRKPSNPQTPKASPRSNHILSPSSTTTSTDESSPKKPKGNQSQSLRDAIAKARAAKAASLQQSSVDIRQYGDYTLEIDPFNTGTGGNTTLNRKIKTARTEGRLNIASLNLVEIPTQVYEMYTMKLNDGADDGEDEGPKWYENVDLIRLIAADNDIEEVGEELANIFRGLQVIDLHNNMIHRLPYNISTLMNLTSLNLVNNKLGNEAMKLICNITGLVDLRISKNKIEGDLISFIENLTQLEVLELQENKITSLPDSIESLGRLRNLDISHNCLTSIPFRKLKECALIELNISHNGFKGTLIESGVDELSSLQLFDIRSNRISKLSEGSLALPVLKSFFASNNELSSLPAIDGWQELLTCILEYNQMEDLPRGLTNLPKLRILDLTGNNISSLDPTLGSMESLEILKLEGNPLRERVLLGMSLVDLKRTLKGRLGQPALKNSDGTIDATTDSEEINEEVIELGPGGVLDLSKREMDSISRELLECVTPAPLSIEAHHNNLLVISQSIEMFTASLTTVNLSHNRISGDNYLPSKMSLRWLTTLSIANNALTSIRPLLKNLDAPRLEQLDVAANRIKDITGLRPKFPNLIRLYARDNLIEEIPVQTVDGMKVLDLSGNSIAALPPKLGLVTTLRELRVEGNCFRVPRWQVLEKGTEAVLLWLRDKLPPDDSNTEDGFVCAVED